MEVETRMRVNAVFEGGGVKGIALVGAVVAAEQANVTFHQVAGTSVGALVASFIAAGYSSAQLTELVFSAPYQRFVTKDWLYKLSFVGPAIRLFLKDGLHTGDELEQWVAQQLASKGIYTFRDLPLHALRVVASDLTQGKLLVLPDDIAQYGIDPLDLSVAKAVRMSASLPYFFEPVIIYNHRISRPRIAYTFSQKTSYYIVDGGILSNYPLWIFDAEMEAWPPKIPTLGFQLVGKKDAQPREIKGPISMLSALFATMMSAHDDRYIEQHNRFRTIKIPSDMVHTTEFSLSQEQARQLYQSGYEAGKQYFDRWSYSGYAKEMEKNSKKIKR
jgi:NTE family protein